MVDVTIDIDAAEFIRTRGRHLILFAAKVTGCCGIGCAPEPMLEVGRPRRPLDQYRSFDYCGITIHIDKALDIENEQLHISLTRLFAWNSLSLSRKGGL